MIETVVRNYLIGLLDTGVFLEIPQEGTFFVVIEKTGSSWSDHICTSTLAVQSYADSLFEAASLNERVKGAMNGIIELDEIIDCQLDSDYNYTDTDTKKYRYQAVFDITLY